MTTTLTTPESLFINQPYNLYSPENHEAWHRLYSRMLPKWDRFANGQEDLLPFLRENKKSFEATLTRLLGAKDNRAVARMVFYPVVQVGGSIQANSELGIAAAKILGNEFPVTNSKDGERNYFAGDLFFWWEENGNRCDAFPLLEEWSKREFAQTVVIPMYKSACKRK